MKKLLKIILLVEVLFLGAICLSSCDFEDEYEYEYEGCLEERWAWFDVVVDESTLSGGLENGSSVEVNGVEMGFSDIVTSNGAAVVTVEVGDNGVFISNQTFPSSDVDGDDVKSFSVTFSKDVRIKNYLIGRRTDIPEGVYFRIEGEGVSSGENFIPSVVGNSETEVNLDFKAGTITYFKAGQVYTFSHNAPSGSSLATGFSLKSFTLVRILESSGYGYGGYGGYWDDDERICD